MLLINSNEILHFLSVNLDLCTGLASPIRILLWTEPQPCDEVNHSCSKASYNLFTSSGDGGGRSGGGSFRSYFEPPGADGGLYGSGCFHFSSNLSVSTNNICARVRDQQLHNLRPILQVPFDVLDPTHFYWRHIEIECKLLDLATDSFVQPSLGPA